MFYLMYLRLVPVIVLVVVDLNIHLLVFQEIKTWVVDTGVFQPS